MPSRNGLALAGDFEDQMLGSETRGGFRLFDLLSRQYDVVAANPPYMGAANFGRAVEEIVNSHYSIGKSDLYSAFIARCLELRLAGGEIAMVTLNSWMFLGSFTDLRINLIRREHLRLVVQLARHAFSESDPPGNAVLFLLSPFGGAESETTATRLTITRLANDQASIVAAFCRTNHISGELSFSRNMDDGRRYIKLQTEFLHLPDHVIAFWIPDCVTRLFSGPRIGEFLEVVNRTKTGKNERYVRYHWEVREAIGQGRNWLVYQKGGDYCTYFGNNENVIRWDKAQQRYFRSEPSCRITDEIHTCREVLTYNSMGRQFCGRIAPPVSTYDVGGASLAGPHENLLIALAVLNSPVGSYIVKALNGSINIQSSDVASVPLPGRDAPVTVKILAGADAALALREKIAASIPREYTFTKSISLEDRLDLEEQFIRAKDDLACLVREALELGDDEATCSLPLETIWESLKSVSGDTKLREAHKEASLIHLMVGTLRSSVMFGQPKVGGESIASPLGPMESSNCVGARMCGQLPARLTRSLVQKCPGSASRGFAALFTERTGKSIEATITSDLASFHTAYFRFRPIIWQIQSGPFANRRHPGYACLAYYHKLDIDLIRKIRKLAEDLRTSRETECRGILAIAAEARSERQAERISELEEAMLEMLRFDTILETVSTSGFGPPSLIEVLRQYAIDDAMLALKVRWLRRLTELIAKAALPDWLAAADRAELHPDLRSWIANAMTHLDYFCASVGPKPSDHSELATDPTTADLARLINLQADSMLKDALELACDEWWKQFEEVVLAPDKERIKELKEQQRDCEEQLDADPGPSASEIRQLKYRVKEIKADVKILTAQIKKRTARADTIRRQIRSWQSKEPASWGDWLAVQPLFDRISSLDGRRATPRTIAEFMGQESLYAPDINDGVRVNIAPLQKAGLLAADVLAAKDLDKAIADRAEWRADERRWVREGKLPQPGWWPE